ncbi:MAG: CmcI family methyltransferase, partial [Chitinophagaceae bacterium]
MKVLVTGATGFIGNNVVKELIAQKHEVIASSVNKDKAAAMEWVDAVTYIPFNLESFDNTVDYYSFFKKPDLLIHLAWEGLPNYKSSFHEEINLPRHYAFLRNLISHGLSDLTITGTCFEYGMQEGCLTETMETKPANPYGRAKDTLRRKLEDLISEFNFSLKWVRLFYMYGKGQNPNSLLSQLDNALINGDERFNMSGGQQIRDYLPVEVVAANIVKISTQTKIQGVINNCSGNPVTVQSFVENYLKRINKNIILNLGYYPYSDLEPMNFWGDSTKLKQVLIMSNPIQEFNKEREDRIESFGEDAALLRAATDFNIESNKKQYSYNFSWMGRPIIQYPQDMIAMQELIWEIKPDLIIETGIAHGGSLIYYASLLELIGNGEVLGIDI